MFKGDLSKLVKKEKSFRGVDMDKVTKYLQKIGKLSESGHKIIPVTCVSDIIPDERCGIRILS